jgi:hypothetical protein
MDKLKINFANQTVYVAMDIHNFITQHTLKNNPAVTTEQKLLS